MIMHIADLCKNITVIDRESASSRSFQIPPVAGVYFWFFDEIPMGVPKEGCIKKDDLFLLYVGAAPKKLSPNRYQSAEVTIRDHIHDHFNGNAAASSLRLSLGCLLATQLRLELRRVGSATRLTFSDGEKRLSEWMGQHAFVGWIEHPKPWPIVDELIVAQSLPLNFDGNTDHVFWSQLNEMRGSMKSRARALPIVS